MITFLTTLLALIITASARPKGDLVPTNMVTVPTNCPEGQQLVNGVCRDIWIYGPYDDLLRNEVNEKNAPRNMITVPVNCPIGQEFINGVCRDIWKLRFTSPIPPMVKKIENERLTKLIDDIKSTLLYHRNRRQVSFDGEEMLQLLDEIHVNRNIISVPYQCPAGYKPDILGICRPIFDQF